MRKTNRIGQETDGAVIRALRENGGSATVMETAEALRWKENTARVVLERLFNDGRLIRRNMKVKMYVNGHADKRSRYVYTLTEMQDILGDVYDAPAKVSDVTASALKGDMPAEHAPVQEVQQEPEFDLMPEGMTDRPAAPVCADTAPTPGSQRDRGISEEAVQGTAVPAHGHVHEHEHEHAHAHGHISETAVDEPEPAAVANGTPSMTYAEALVAVFEGKKVVSDVTGTIYLIADTPGNKGLVSSKDTGKVVLSFSEEEKHGTWHIKAEAGACPFCGSPSKLTTVTKSGGKRFHRYTCTNEVCLAEGPLSKDVEGAAIAYNRRA